MCEALETLELLEPDSGKLTASATARAHLVAGAPGDLRPYFASLRERPAVRELADVLRTGRPAAWASAAAGDEWAGRLDDPGFAEEFTAAMDARARVLAPALAQALADVPARRVLDIAGGSGAYGCALLDGRSEIQVAVLERPPVDEVARTLLRRRGYDSVDVVSGDMFEVLPAGYDLHLYSHVLHDWDIAAVEALLRSSFAALPSGGRVVDYDAHLDSPREAAVAAYSCPPDARDRGPLLRRRGDLGADARGRLRGHRHAADHRRSLRDLRPAAVGTSSSGALSSPGCRRHQGAGTGTRGSRPRWRRRESC